MPMARMYQTFEVRQMLQRAEHSPSPVTGIGAHSRTLHAGATPGGVGATPASMMDRTHKRPGESNTQFSNRPGTSGTTSAFKNQLQQADAVCQALNSAKGQQALRSLDMPAYAAHNVRLTIEFGPIKEAGYLPGSGAAPMATVKKADAAIRRPAGGTAGVRVIMDRGAGQNTFHIQTCMPLDTMAASKYDLRNMDVNPATILVNG